MQGAPCCPQTIAQHNAVKDACLHVDSTFGDIFIHDSQSTSKPRAVSVRRFFRNGSDKPHLLKATSLVSNEEQHLQDMTIRDVSQSITITKKR